MDLTRLLARHGGASSKTTLVAELGAAEFNRALERGLIVRTARGRYAATEAPAHVHLASGLGGTVSHRSAAAHWGWAQKALPDQVEITVPRNRRVPRRLRWRVIPHWSDLPPEDIDGIVTTRHRTLVDCMRNLPWDEALAIIDSALRRGDITKRELLTLADSTRGRGRARIRAVAHAATHLAANPFESVLRAQALLIPGLQVVAQAEINRPDGSVVRPDLADEELRLVIEAESFAWHGKRPQLTQDCARYNSLSLTGWQVVRFSWEQVIHDPAYVQRTLITAVTSARARHANVAQLPELRPGRVGSDIRMSGGLVG